MGKYLNPGTVSFENALNSKIYVDKTGMIGYLNSLVNTEQKYVCVSRPRRFGKTMATNMICAYYDRTAESRVLFSDKKLANQDKWDTFLSRFDVIHVVMTSFIKRDISVKDALELMTKRILNDLHRAYPDVEYDPTDIEYSFDEFYQETGIPFVIVIDEWDAVFRMRKDDKDGQTEYLDFLRSWLKDQDYVALAYMTGILPIKKYGEHSALNMFYEYSMVEPKQLAEYTGYTEEEVSALCREYGRDYDEMKSWYDGYTVPGIIPPKMGPDEKEPPIYSIYSPYSVNNAIDTGIYKSYWNSTESYVALEEYIRRNFDGLKETVALLMDGAHVKADLTTYQNDMTTFTRKDDVLALLVHLGYLSYIPPTQEERNRGESGMIFIPNREVLEEFRTSTKSDEWTPAFRSFDKSKELVEATWNCDEDKVAELLEWFHDQTSNKTYNDESALSYSIQLAYYAAQKYYTDILELDSGKGYADIVYLPAPKYPSKPVLLIELKFGKNTNTALDQIKKQNYPQRLEHYKGNILLVGINYDKEAKNSNRAFKHHSCVIEKA